MTKRSRHIKPPPRKKVEPLPEVRRPGPIGGVRDTNRKEKAAAIKGSPVVGPRKASSGGGASSFDSSFAAARKAGKSTFTWRGKKYNTKLRGE